MIEPEVPVTIQVPSSFFPVFLLANDEDKPVLPSMIILRHRHLEQQQKIIVSAPSDTPGAKPTRGTIVDVVQNTISTALPGDVPVARPSTSTHASSPQASNSSQSRSLPSTPDVYNARTSASATPKTAKVPTSRPAAPVEESVNDAPSSQDMKVSRSERTIRSRREKTVWFASSSTSYLEAPLSVEARFGDLYVHTSTNGSKQVWMKTQSGHWISIDLRHPHPYLPGYVLNFCANGEPSWVKKETFSTYAARSKKRRADTGKQHSSPASTSPSPLSV
ncbi:hypothetical protein FKP32DRAFT_1671812 [Trametes sanguinea]|nr:hypothetical protein FKP32DRAFT_1671812 [Trametes sanguinea]